MRGRHAARHEGRAGQSRGGLLEPPAHRPAVDALTERPRRFRTRTGAGAAGLLGVIAAVLMAAFWWQTASPGATLKPLSTATPPAAAGGEAGDEAAGGGDGPAAAERTGGGADGGADAEGSASDGAAPPGTLDTDPGPLQTRRSGLIVVHVAGAVARPGVLELPEGSRLHVALTAVGGQTEAADPDRLNLAAVLADGQRIFVPRLGEPDQFDTAGGAAGGAAGAGIGARADGKINLNTAAIEQLGTLPRVGPVLAQRIIDWRIRHGGFKKVAELDAVDGIGPKLLEVLLPLVTV